MRSAQVIGSLLRRCAPALWTVSLGTGHISLTITSTPPERWWQGLGPLFVRAYEQAGVDHHTALAAAALMPRVYVDPRHWAVFDDTKPTLTRQREAGRCP